MLTACYNDNKEELYQNYENAANPCDSATGPSYSADISPILTSTCAVLGCHTGDTPQNGIHLGVYADVRQVARDGRLMATITGDPGPQMPPSGSPLSAQQISLIEEWIEAGACQN